MTQKGYLPHHVIKAFVFWTLSACIASATASGILRSWGTIGHEVAANCLWTALILAAGSTAFLIINCLFGDLGHLLLGQGESSPSADPAFSDRLRRAKAVNQPEEPSSGTDRSPP